MSFVSIRDLLQIEHKGVSCKRSSFLLDFFSIIYVDNVDKVLHFQKIKQRLMQYLNFRDCEVFEYWCFQWCGLHERKKAFLVGNKAWKIFNSRYSSSQIAKSAIVFFFVSLQPGWCTFVGEDVDEEFPNIPVKIPHFWTETSPCHKYFLVDLNLFIFSG